MRAYNISLLNHAKVMRKDMTSAEKHIWFNYLKDCGFKFRHQRPFRNYVVDFYCAKPKLIIEIDGETHFNEKSITYDQQRTTFLESLGLTVIRFTNTEVFHEFDGVKEKLNTIFEMLKRPPRPLWGTRQLLLRCPTSCAHAVVPLRMAQGEMKCVASTVPTHDAEGNKVWRP